MMATKVDWLEIPARYIRKGDQFQTGARRTVYTALSDPKPHNSIESKILVSWTDDSDWCKAGSTTYFPRADYTLYRKVVTEVPDEPVQKLDLSGDETVDRLRSIAQYWYNEWRALSVASARGSGSDRVPHDPTYWGYWKDLYEKERTAKNQARDNAKKLTAELQSYRHIDRIWLGRAAPNKESLDHIIAFLQRIRAKLG